MKLTACLIVRDEERHLDACLSRIAKITDSIVVVDTGSKDASPDIARAYGAKLIHDPWREDFSYSRNLALDHAEGDWILYIDADERLEAEQSDLACLDQPDLVAATVDFRAAAILTRYPEFRLFRNRPDLKFRGVIHETIRPDLRTILAKGNARVIASRICIEHLGYEGDLSSKHRRNHGMLLRETERDPERIYLWHALGECESGLGNHTAAEHAFRTGLTRVRASRGEASDALIYADLFSLHFGQNDIQLPEIDELVEEAQRNHPDDPLIQWWSARHLMEKHEFQSARKLLEQILQRGENSNTTFDLAYDRRLFGAYSLGLLGNCDLAEGRYTEAVRYFEKAGSADPDNHELRIKLQLARSLCKQKEKTGLSKT